MSLLDSVVLGWNGWQVGLADTGALAAVALIGYLFGQRSRAEKAAPEDARLVTELTRATQIARELQQIAGRIREDVAVHQVNINDFKQRLTDVESHAAAGGWQTLSQEAENLLMPTMKLASNLSMAYDDLRRQSNQLMTFAGSRSDQETGLRNRRAMEEQIGILLSIHAQDSSRFSLAVFSVGNDEKPAAKSQLTQIATLLQSTARDTDIVARYSREEFVVLMPQTSLAGATIFSQRLLDTAEKELGLFVFGGIVEVHSGDTLEKLLSRADSALYSARSDGASCLYQHTGKTIRLHESAPQACTDECLAFSAVAE